MHDGKEKGFIAEGRLETSPPLYLTQGRDKICI